MSVNFTAVLKDIKRKSKRNESLINLRGEISLLQASKTVNGIFDQNIK